VRAMGQVSRYINSAIDVIQEGCAVNVMRNGEPVGRATTIVELDRLLGTPQTQ
jgi:hypothetical protein